MSTCYKYEQSFCGRVNASLNDAARRRNVRGKKWRGSDVIERSQLAIVVKIERHGEEKYSQLEKPTIRRAAVKSTDQDRTQTGRRFLQQVVCYTHKW